MRHLFHTNRVKPFFLPPSLLLRQLGSALLMAYLNGWRKLPQWLVQHSLKSIPVSNGALGMGCIGYPGHPVWEVTAACNLSCIHCHAASDKPDPNELSTDEGKTLIDQIAEVDGFRTLVYTGGEPLVRPDILDLLKHSQATGFANIIATNGTLIDDDMAWKLKEHGVVCNAISIDASDPEIHNFVRKSPQAFDLALRAIDATKKAGILLQINPTAMEYHMDNLASLIDFVDGRDVSIMLMYQLVAVGRGEKIEKATLKKSANENLSRLISEKQRHATTIIEPVAGPQYWPYLLEKKGFELIRAGRIEPEVHMHGDQVVANGNALQTFPEEPQEEQTVLAPGDRHRDAVAIMNEVIAGDRFPHQSPYFPLNRGHRPNTFSLVRRVTDETPTVTQVLLSPLG